jgi:hypothetical protein
MIKHVYCFKKLNKIEKEIKLQFFSMLLLGRKNIKQKKNIRKTEENNSHVTELNITINNLYEKIKPEVINMIKNYIVFTEIINENKLNKTQFYFNKKG